MLFYALYITNKTKHLSLKVGTSREWRSVFKIRLVYSVVVAIFGLKQLYTFVEKHLLNYKPGLSLKFTSAYVLQHYYVFLSDESLLT